jgi:potassium voltage-gated channel KQT-like subfamily protein 5
MVIVVWLSFELILRVWSAGCRSRFQTWRGRLRFMRNPFVILDLVVIIFSILLTIVATSQNKHKSYATVAFRGLRFFQILRMLRVDRRAGTWRLLGTVVWAHRQVI